MKNYKVKATRNFIDSVENVSRNANDEFLCTEERYEYLNSCNNAVILVKIIDKENEIDDKLLDETKNEDLENSKKKSKKASK